MDNSSTSLGSYAYVIIEQGESWKVANDYQQKDQKFQERSLLSSKRECCEKKI